MPTAYVREPGAFARGSGPAAAGGAPWWCLPACRRTLRRGPSPSGMGCRCQGPFGAGRARAFACLRKDQGCRV